MIGSALRGLTKLSTTGLSKGPHATRYYAYRHLAQHRERRPARERVLSISGSQSLCKILGYKPRQIVNIEYPEANMLALPFEDGAFDAVVSDQVLEHVEGNPLDAIGEVFRVLKPGGISLQATCLMVPIHRAPGDFWRFTPDGLRLLCEPHGEVIDAGGWGNPAFQFYSLIGLRHVPVPHARWHPVNWVATWNHGDWPVFTWAYCRKTGDDASQ